jgi:hypothetical protein
MSETILELVDRFFPKCDCGELATKTYRDEPVCPLCYSELMEMEAGADPTYDFQNNLGVK